MLNLLFLPLPLLFLLATWWPDFKTLRRNLLLIFEREKKGEWFPYSGMPWRLSGLPGHGFVLWQVLLFLLIPFLLCNVRGSIWWQQNRTPNYEWMQSALFCHTACCPVFTFLCLMVGFHKLQSRQPIIVIEFSIWMCVFSTAFLVLRQSWNLDFWILLLSGNHDPSHF